MADGFGRDADGRHERRMPAMSDVPRSSDRRREAIEDLRSTTDSIRGDLGRLAEIEDAKRDLDPADPKVDRLSADAVELADRILHEAKAERHLANEIG